MQHSGKIAFIEAEILDQYLADDGNRPWILGLSGGKDSTMLAQMVWYAIKALPIEARKRDIHIVCNNTKVENPTVIRHIDKVLKQIETAATIQSMPIRVHRTSPNLKDSFWVKLIGSGYPAPNRVFRWCTSRLKIDPTTQFIKQKISERGEVILLLGTRESESANRGKTMKSHEFGHYRLRKHTLPNSYMYPPLRHVHTEEVWAYLLAVPSPWGAKNRDLVTMYRNASGGECPLVVDTSSPSCGNSRFGCWTCTVVKRDKSMEALVDNGEEWMQPMLDYRDLLEQSKDRMDWRMEKSRAKTDKAGPYLFSTRIMLLEELLKAQIAVQAHDPTLQLINSQELVAIQVMWFREGFFSTKVSQIIQKVESLYSLSHAA